MAVMALASVAAVSAMGDGAPNKMKATAKNASGGGTFSEVDVSGSMYLGSAVAKLTVTVSVGKDKQDLKPHIFVSILCEGEGFPSVFESSASEAEFNKKGKYTEKFTFTLADYIVFDDDFNEVPAKSAENCNATITGTASNDGSADFITVKKLSVTAKAS
ncbi:MAG: hypothetical protein V3V01_04665 [Acidimicrobiales bacterium]